MEEQGGIRDTQAQVDDQQGQSDLSRGRAKTIQRRAASTGKAFATRLAFQPLDAVRASPRSGEGTQAPSAAQARSASGAAHSWVA